MNVHQSDLAFCHGLGPKGFRPYSLMTFDGIGEVEFISYPWPEDDVVYINARTTPGDPTTMNRYRIERGTLVLACQHSEIYPDGNCVKCSVFVTSLPGHTRHKVVSRQKNFENNA